MAPKKKRKPSAYNKFVGRRIKAGRTFKQAVSDWNAQKKGKKITRKRRSSPSPKKAKKRRKPMARKKKRKSAKRRIPLIPTAIGALYAISLLQGSGSFENKLQKVQADFTGFSGGSFNWNNLKVGLFPIAIGVIISRMMSKARLQPDWPIVRL